MTKSEQDVLERELSYHEKLYSGFAQRHFARPAVRALRAHMVERMLRLLPDARSARVLSLGCGIGDTEILLAPHVRELRGVDLSPTAIQQAVKTRHARGSKNTQFVKARSALFTASSTWCSRSSFCTICPTRCSKQRPAQIARMLAPGGTGSIRSIRTGIVSRARSGRSDPEADAQVSDRR